MDNVLLLQSKNDIPFAEAQCSIHQPTINEISLIGEENFFAGCQFLNFSKDKLSEQDKVGLEEKTDFEIFMSIMNSSEKMIYKNSAYMLLTLIFPDYEIKFTNNEILLANNQGMVRINNENYDIFKDILISMFELNDSDIVQGGYNPSGKRAEKIAEKLRKYKEKVAQIKGNEKQKITVFSRYVSILAVGLQKDKNSLMEYTIPQLKDEFKRFQMKQSFDVYIQAKMAGAQNLEEVDNWMNEIHP